jgi:peptide/nickel transport system permease protein
MRTGVYFLPGDPAEYLAHEALVNLPIEELRSRMNLGRTPVERFFSSPMGTSLVQGKPTWPLIRDSFFRTLTLSALTVFWLILASTLLLYLSRLSSRAERTLDLLSLAIASTPLFVAGPVFLIIFSIQLGWFPVSRSVWLPSMVLALYLTGFWYRNLKDRLDQYFWRSAVPGARSRGINEWKVFIKYLLMPCLGGYVGFIAAQLSTLLNGSLLVELIFQWNGIGLLLHEAILSRDYPIIEGTLLLLSSFTIVILFFGEQIRLRWESKLR